MFPLSNSFSDTPVHLAKIVSLSFDLWEQNSPVVVLHGAHQHDQKLP